MAELKRTGHILEPRLNHFVCDIPSLKRILAQ